MLAAIVLLIVAAGYFFSQSQSKNALSTAENTKNTLKIAVLLPLTGPGANGAQYSKEGFEMAIEDIKASGGNVTIKYEDTQTNPKTAISIFQHLQLGSTKPQVIIPELSSVTKALKPLLKNDFLTVATGVSVPNIADPASQLYRVFLSAEGVGNTGAEYAIHAGHKSVAIVYVNDEYGQSSMTAFKNKFEENGGMVFTETFSILEKDFRTQWQKILHNSPKSLFITGYGPGYLTVLKQLRDTNFDGLIMTDWSLTSPEYLNATGGVRDGTIVVTVNHNTSFEKRYQDKYKKQGFMINVGYSYDTLLCIWEAYKQSDGSVQNMAKAFGVIKNLPGFMGNLSITSSGDVTVNYRLKKVDSGQLVPLNE